MTHLHGGHTPPDSDGYPTDLVVPAGGWRFASAEQARVCRLTTEPVKDYVYPQRQRAATLWYHDHRMDFTGPQVWRGLAGFHLLHEVSGVRHRLRLLNASNARHLELTLDPAPEGAPAFTQVGSDGGLLSAPIAHDRIAIAPAERYDVVVDFGRWRPGTDVTLRDADAGDVMRFRGVRAARDESAVPARLSTIEPLDPAEAVAERSFRFARGPRRDGGDPDPLDAGWKDTVKVRGGEKVRVIARFTGYRGRYVFHCHNLEHEDMAMMANIRVQ